MDGAYSTGYVTTDPLRLMIPTSTEPEVPVSNVKNFPTKPVDPVKEMMGPDRFGASIIVDGHEVPNIYMVDCGETVQLVFDGPVIYTIPREMFPLVASACAKAMAVGAGHSHISSEHAVTKAYGPKVNMITSVESL